MSIGYKAYRHTPTIERRPVQPNSADRCLTERATFSPVKGSSMSMKTSTG